MLILAEAAQDLGALVLMEHRIVLFPDVDVLLPDAEKHRNIFLRDHMTFAEHGVLRDAADNLRHVVAEHLPHRVLGSDQLHHVSSFY